MTPSQKQKITFGRHCMLKDHSRNTTRLENVVYLWFLFQPYIYFSPRSATPSSLSQWTDVTYEEDTTPPMDSTEIICTEWLQLWSAVAFFSTSCPCVCTPSDRSGKSTLTWCSSWIWYWTLASIYFIIRHTGTFFFYREVAPLRWLVGIREEVVRYIASLDHRKNGKFPSRIFPLFRILSMWRIDAKFLMK